MKKGELGKILEANYIRHNRPGFTVNDPVSLPHLFSRKEDIEITAFFTASISWGQRSSIIASGKRLLGIFDHAPFDFITGHSDSDLKRIERFVHRTFNTDDLLSFIAFLRYIYEEHGGLESAFSSHMKKGDRNVEHALNGFRMLYSESPFALKRTLKHIAWPAGGSACKRLNMFLRWMVRDDGMGVDFGLWKSISPSQLVCPLDVHVLRQALKLGLIEKEKNDWKTAVALTERLKSFDAADPVRFDIALFGMGIDGKKANIFDR